MPNQGSMLKISRRSLYVQCQRLKTVFIRFEVQLASMLRVPARTLVSLMFWNRASYGWTRQWTLLACQPPQQVVPSSSYPLMVASPSTFSIGETCSEDYCCDGGLRSETCTAYDNNLTRMDANSIVHPNF
ncbi:uncharacterized protein LOC112090446 [Morus notabilis]|uniref:uncharacterized protein LOC112090446 n=1 Tax=Morus notabilis TaxID=981085 RepID=UPI000CED7DFB|nr:uncharacterized protein LOC112090446 [Morus notabilis]